MTPATKPTLEDFVKHFEKYGLENSHSGYRDKPERYKSFNSLQKDSIVATAVHYLTNENFVALVHAVGYQSFADEAAAWWTEERKRWADELTFFTATWELEKGANSGDSELHIENPPDTP